METEFTPIASLAGGALIGLATVFMLGTTGRLIGVSGMLRRFFPPLTEKAAIPQAVFFFAGLLLAAPIWLALTGEMPYVTASQNTWLIAIAGLLVGAGATLGNGCTSGHGICGLSRFSVRSLAATVTFMATAFITVTIVRTF